MKLPEFKDIINSNPIVLFYFTATWCKNCREFARALRDIRDELKCIIPFIEIDTDKNHELIHYMGIIGIPSLIIYNNQRAVYYAMGQNTKSDLKEKISTYCATDQVSELL